MKPQLNSQSLPLIRVAAYIRVSTEQQDQKNSYETQEKYFSSLLEQNPDWISAGLYSDYGISGTYGKKRPGFIRLLRHCAQGRVDRILCKSISRFARNTGDFITALRILKENHVSIFFEKEQLDTQEENGEFILTVLAAIAQEESRSISENITWGLRRGFARGDARNPHIYGYRPGSSGTMDILEPEAAIVQRIYQEISSGATYTEVARHLNMDHIPAPHSIYGMPKEKSQSLTSDKPGKLKHHLEQGWTSEQISRILRLERYTGDVLLQKTFTSDYLTHRIQRNNGELPQYLIREHHPAVISHVLFEEVGRIRQNNQKIYGRKKRSVLPYSGRFVCAECGRFYHTRNRQSHALWFCPTTALNNGLKLCSSEKIYEEQLNHVFYKAIADRFHLSESPGSFITQLQQRLYAIQETDHMERDRSFLKRNPAKCQSILQLEDPKRYWDAVERDYDSRQEAMEWLSKLPPGERGCQAFFQERPETYFRAFVLSVMVHSPYLYTFQWFDGTKSVVKIDSREGQTK